MQSTFSNIEITEFPNRLLLESVSVFIFGFLLIDGFLSSFLSQSDQIIFSVAQWMNWLYQQSFRYFFFLHLSRFAEATSYDEEVKQATSVRILQLRHPFPEILCGRKWHGKVRWDIHPIGDNQPTVPRDLSLGGPIYFESYSVLFLESEKKRTIKRANTKNIREDCFF